MATVNLRTPEISPARNIRGSLHFFHKRNNLHVHKSLVFPLAVKSMKIAFSRTSSIFQTYHMPTSSFTIRTSEQASHIKDREMSPAPEIGVSVFILKGNKILFGRRRSVSVGNNTYGLPGGHLELGESYEECAIREVKEETGLDIKNIEPLTSINNICHDATYLDIIFVRAYLSDPNKTPQNLEPDKCEGWKWYDLENLPEPMYGPLREMLEGGFNPFIITV